MSKVYTSEEEDASRAEYNRTLDWLYEQKTAIESARYGRNYQAVRDAIADQEARARRIVDYKPHVDHVIEQPGSREEKARLQTAYKNLVEVSQKKINCLQTMLQVTDLEDGCGDFSRKFDVRAVKLVNPEERKRRQDQGDMDQIPGFVAPSTQDCIFAAEDNWNWLVRLVQCIEIHLKNASAYHQYFHEMDESTLWMMEDIRRLEKSFDLTPLKGDYMDAKRLLSEFDELLTALKQWETKTNFMWDKAMKIVPVHLRTQGIKEPTPIRALATYETKEISVREGEDLLLLDNSKPNMWKVRNGRRQEGMVPAVICLIPGPHKQAIDAAVKMRMMLLTTWTNILKRMGMRLMCFMLLVFKPTYTEDEIGLLSSIRMTEKTDLIRILDFIENSLKTHWSDHEAFVNLQERILTLRMILDEAGDNPLEDENTYKALVVQIGMLEKLMDKYQEFQDLCIKAINSLGMTGTKDKFLLWNQMEDLWKDWELFKVALESSRQPELMLIVDKWEQLQYVSREYFNKFWQHELPMSEQEAMLKSLQELTTSELASEQITEGLLTIEGDAFARAVESGAAVTQGLPRREEEETISIIKVTQQHQAAQGNKGRRHGDDIEHKDSGMFEHGQRTVVTSMLHEGVGTEQVTEDEGSFGHGQRIDGTRTHQLLHAGVGTEQVTEDEGSFGHGERIDGIRTHQLAGGRDTGDGLGRIKVNIVSTLNRHGLGHMGEFGEEGESIDSLHTEQLSSARETRADESGFGKANILTTLTQHGLGFMGSFGEDESSFGAGEFETTTSLEGMQQQAIHGLDDTEFGYASVTKTAKTEQISAHEMEERKTFLIQSVVDPRSGSDIALNEAIMLGIINVKEGQYVDIHTDQRMPIPLAMTRGLIKVEFTRTRVSKEKTSSIGIITVKTIREHMRPYRVRTVTDTLTGEILNEEQATERGLFEPQHGVFRDNKTRREMLITDAVSAGLMDVEYVGDAPPPEVVATTYAVRAVVDRARKAVITFQDAVRRGIIKRDTGAFHDTITGEDMYVGDAIMRGFLKARKIDDSKHLDIDPANRMVIDKTETIRKKIIRPLSVISAFRKAAQLRK